MPCHNWNGGLTFSKLILQFIAVTYDVQLNRIVAYHTCTTLSQLNNIVKTAHTSEQNVLKRLNHLDIMTIDIGFIITMR